MLRRWSTKSVLTVGLVFGLVFLWVNTVPAMDAAALLEKAKAQNARFEQEVKVLVLEQEMKMFIPQGESTSQIKIYRQGEKFRTETKTRMPQGAGGPSGMGEIEMVVISDGRDVWMINPFSGKTKVPPDEAKMYRGQNNLLESMTDVKYLGDEKVNGRDCHVVEGKISAEFPKTKYWLDRNTLAPVKAEGLGPKGEKMEWKFADYKKVGSEWEIPGSSEMYLNGKLTSVTTVKTVKIDQAIPDELFDPAKVQVQGPNLQEMMKKMQRQQQGGRD